MAAFLASVPNGSTIDLAAGGRYRMEATFTIAGRHNLTIRGNGATFVATTPGHDKRANVRIADSSGITVQGLRVEGANPAAGKRGPYRPERNGQHGFDLQRSRNIQLLGVTVTDVYGDFVYLGRHDGGRPTEGVLIQASTFMRSGRQGITLTGAHNVTIETSLIAEAKRASIDLEPGNGAGSSIDRVTIRNNQVRSGGLFFVAANGHGPVNNITVEGNRLTGMTMGMDVNDRDGGRRSGWRVTSNSADLPSGGIATMRFTRIDGLTVTGNVQPMKPYRNMVGVLTTDSCNVVVSNNTFTDGGTEHQAVGTC